MSADPRGPVRKIQAVDLSRRAVPGDGWTYLTMEPCGHVGAFVSHHHYNVGDDQRCFDCRSVTA